MLNELKNNALIFSWRLKISVKKYMFQESAFGGFRERPEGPAI